VPVYARHLRANQFGVLSLLAVTLTLVTIVLKFGLNHAFFRHYYEAKEDDHRRRIVGSTLIFLVGSSLLLTALLCLAAPQVSQLIFAGDATRADLLQLIFLTAFFEVITLIPDSILRAKFKSATYSVLNIIAFAVQIGLISYLVLAVDASVENVLIGRLGGTAFEALLFFFAARAISV
jgi:O-antigen/teichoic acid export membrane protein